MELKRSQTVIFQRVADVAHLDESQAATSLPPPPRRLPYRPASAPPPLPPRHVATAPPYRLHAAPTGAGARRYRPLPPGGSATASSLPPASLQPYYRLPPGGTAPPLARVGTSLTRPSGQNKSPRTDRTHGAEKQKEKKDRPCILGYWTLRP